MAKQKLRKFKQSGFSFEETASGAKVTKGSDHLGEIITTQEVNGRYCFHLSGDNRRQPRTYRGRILAAKALECIKRLKQEAHKHKWSQEALIMAAWADRPASAPVDKSR